MGAPLIWSAPLNLTIIMENKQRYHNATRVRPEGLEPPTPTYQMWRSTN